MLHQVVNTWLLTKASSRSKFSCHFMVQNSGIALFYRRIDMRFILLTKASGINPFFVWRSVCFVLALQAGIINPDMKTRIIRKIQGICRIGFPMAVALLMVSTMFVSCIKDAAPWEEEDEATGTRGANDSTYIVRFTIVVPGWSNEVINQ